MSKQLQRRQHGMLRPFPPNESRHGVGGKGLLGCHPSIHTEYECGIPRDFPAHKTLLPSADHQTERSESPTPEHNFVVVGFVTAFGAFMLHSELRGDSLVYWRSMAQLLASTVAEGTRVYWQRLLF